MSPSVTQSAAEPAEPRTGAKGNVGQVSRDAVLAIGERLTEAPSDRLADIAFARELKAQLGLTHMIGWVDLAHTLCLAEQGVVPDSSARALVAALLELHAVPSSFAPAAEYGDLYTNREAWLAARTPAVGWLGVARARREALTTAYHLALCDEILGLGKALATATETLSSMSLRHKDSLMPDYTYLQAAQPTTFGHYLQSFAWPTLRDLDRLRGLHDRVDQCPAGIGSSNGSVTKQNRRGLSDRLGFRRPVRHARDAMWQADLALEASAIASTAAAAVTRRCSGSGREWFYFGTTVQDLTDTWLMLTLREARRILIADLDRAITAAEDLCRRHRDTVMAGRTHGQQGLPITFGFKAAGWLAELRRHRRRFDEAAKRMDVGQLCGGVGSLSAMGSQALAVQKRFLERLGLREPDMSWTASRDLLAEWAHLLVLSIGTADRIGHEVYNLQRDEIGELRERSLTEGVGSITMPHKRNPETAEHLGTLARVVRANAGLLAESLVHDHECDGRSWKAEWHAVPELSMAAGKAHDLLAALLEGLEVRADRMRANLEAAGGYPLSEGVMLALARRVGKQTAHRMVHRLVASAWLDGLSFSKAIARDRDICGLLSQEELDLLLSVDAQIGQCRVLVDRVLEMGSGRRAP